MNIENKFKTVREIMENHENAKFDGNNQIIESKSQNELYTIRNEIIRAGIDEVYDIIYNNVYEVYILSLHLTKGRSW